jgi:hypothetical protein
MIKMCHSPMKINCFVGYFLLFISLFFLSGNLIGATIIVGPPPASIQAAINSAASGDTVQLSAGTYIEQIQVISKSINIVGAGENSTIIQSPGPLTPLTQFFTFGSNFWCVVMIDNQAAPTLQTVNISDLTVDGDNQQDTTILPSPSPGFYGSSNRFFAIGYHNASGTVENVHTTNTRQSSNFNELAGGGIVNASSSGAVTFNVTNSLVDFYQRQGIDLRGSTLTANISNSTINRGYVLTPNTSTATPSGIQYSGGATGSITDNVVEGNISTVLGAQATGLIPFGAGPNLIISGNTINNNDIGIAAIQNGNNLIIQNNTLNFTTTPGVNPDEGIVVQDTNGLTTITSNIMNNIPDVNMDLSTTTGTNQNFQLMNNQFIGSQTGLLVSGVTGAPSTGPVITMNGDSFTGTIGYYIQESTAPNTAPNDIWPSTATVSFDGLISGHITFAEFSFILTKIFDKHNDPTLGLVLDFITPTPPTLTQINPTSGPTAGGNTVTITGTSFLSSNTTVFFGATPATNVVVVSDTVITATAPPGVGTVDVTVVTPFGTTPIVPADQYTYIQAFVSPSLSKFFNPDEINIGANSTLTITLSNSNNTDATLTAPLIDNLPAGIVVNGTSSNTCGGTVTANIGTSIITLTGGEIPANGSCTISVVVRALSEGTVTNNLPAGALQTDLGENANPATAGLSVVVVAPTLSKVFSPNTICKGATSTLIITLSNSNNVAATLTAPLIDNLPPGVKVKGNAHNNCGGVVTAIKGTSKVKLTGGEIPANDSCTISVIVHTLSRGTVTNILPIGTLQTELGENASSATATITTVRGNSCHDEENNVAWDDGNADPNWGSGGSFGAIAWPIPISIPPIVTPEPVVNAVVSVNEVPPINVLKNEEPMQPENSLVSMAPLAKTDESAAGCSNTGESHPLMGMSIIMYSWFLLNRRKQK